MSASNATAPAPAIPIAPPGTNFLAVIAPSLRSLVIGHTFLSIFVPLILSLFYFSTSHLRRRAVFWLNVLAIVLAFAAGIMIDALAIHSILSPQSPWGAAMNIAIGILGAWQSILVDFILMIRIVSVYPLHRVGTTKFGFILALPVALKLERIINMIVFIKVLADAMKGPNGNEVIELTWGSTPYLKIEWFSQIVDNAYASACFLLALQAHRHQRSTAVTSTKSNVSSLTAKLRTIFWIAISNFVIPTLLSIAQIIVVYRAVDILAINDIVLVNTCVAVIGVVFATVWAGALQRRESSSAIGATAVGDVEHSATFSGEPGPGPMRFAPRDTTTTTFSMRSRSKGGIEDPVVVVTDTLSSGGDKIGQNTISSVPEYRDYAKYMGQLHST
ncbi:hypothetical protein CONPUDRAFT_135622 [Coniophora puteana RWD-64-598 SS2]|uniref:STE3-domain-containing protein n=1 Tax=Coniophora puteana (strain RWD-64-598) TaxID=741705 RepID=A0A5M3MXW6_CONPW|nr:uncharacterized protein CONPUDRAFT_135622 [Coniophora puteana RWD-64-598 SS2]EIW84013.1 hypothetical protein CONPUDRAFT_135622 [Coniophora puteana RWD-64-598 SS2]